MEFNAAVGTLQQKHTWINIFMRILGRYSNYGLTKKAEKTWPKTTWSKKQQKPSPKPRFRKTGRKQMLPPR